MNCADGVGTIGIQQMLSDQFELPYEIQQTASAECANLPKTREGRAFPLSWSHYLKLKHQELGQM